MKYVEKFFSISEFETKNLIAKKISPTDLQYLIKMHQSEQVMKTLGGLRSEEKTREYIN